ncbi:hypothetical protein [Phenylobacterium sp.]|uniref:hypothetical protein n=1 Tax=Phenylobacterium sp. TaxID=1871053 RepID=UPI0025EBC830|nr:hypothetical protein [Phenylobacterium sp.]
MALLDGQTQKSYYDSNTFGSYQFVSLQDVIEQFMAIYVGEEKVINKVGRTEVAFHAQRALAELSFDTLKSFKSQSIVLPPSLVMPLPHDYVNYTKLSWCDEAGIKHPLYKTNDTSNPFQILQNEDGSYAFPTNSELISNSDYTNGLEDWIISSQQQNSIALGGALTSVTVDQTEANPKVRFKVNSNKTLGGGATLANGYAPYIYQEVDVTNVDSITFSANATSTAAGTQTISAAEVAAATSNYEIVGGGTYVTPGSIIRVGFSTSPPEDDISMADYEAGGIVYYSPTSNSFPSFFDLGYLEWSGGQTGVKSNTINVSELSGTVYLTVICIVAHSQIATTSYGSSLHFDEGFVDDVILETLSPSTTLKEKTFQLSDTWNKYKAITPAENNNDDYANDDYQRVPDERYGLDPSKAQTNGSFYIDDRIGRIHFSSNVAGKTVILDYISDSLGTEAEMQIHKLAEEAMYKSISYGVLSVKSNIPEYIVMRARKEKIAATRKAKLRLSNIKIEDITQVLRGKSKHIKH